MSISVFISSFMFLSIIFISIFYFYFLSMAFVDNRYYLDYITSKLIFVYCHLPIYSNLLVGLYFWIDYTNWIVQVDIGNCLVASIRVYIFIFLVKLAILIVYIYICFLSYYPLTLIFLAIFSIIKVNVYPIACFVQSSVYFIYDIEGFTWVKIFILLFSVLFYFCFYNYFILNKRTISSLKISVYDLYVYFTISSFGTSWIRWAVDTILGEGLFFFFFSLKISFCSFFKKHINFFFNIYLNFLIWFPIILLIWLFNEMGCDLVAYSFGASVFIIVFIIKNYIYYLAIMLPVGVMVRFLELFLNPMDARYLPNVTVTVLGSRKRNRKSKTKKLMREELPQLICLLAIVRFLFLIWLLLFGMQLDLVWVFWWDNSMVE